MNSLMMNSHCFARKFTMKSSLLSFMRPFSKSVSDRQKKYRHLFSIDSLIAPRKSSMYKDSCEYCKGRIMVKCIECNGVGRVYFDGFKESICDSCTGWGCNICQMCGGGGASCMAF